MSPAGTALVIVLSFIVLLSVLLTAFLSRATLNKQIAYSSAGQYRAEQTAKAGLNTLLGDLQEEIQAGSPSGAQYTVNGLRIYNPKTAKSAAPARIGEVSALPTLLRRSVRSGSTATPDAFPPDETNQAIFAPTVYDSSSVPKNRASASSSQDASPNGHVIPPGRWNKPSLLIQQRQADGTITIPNFAVPDWCLLTRGGAKAFGAWSDTLKDPVFVKTNATQPNFDYVLGRYAYTVYDEGALLNANLTGYPSGMDAPGPNGGDYQRAATGKPAPYYADLRLLGGTGRNGLLSASQVDNFVKWRNATTMGDPSKFLYYTGSVALLRGFLGVTAGDQALISRQDLIGYAKASGWDMNILQSLGTSSRELNAPSFSFAAPTDTNPNFSLAILNGKPIRRFPLNTNLAILEGVTGPGDANAAKVATLFGLTPAPDFSNPGHRHWNYTGTSIKSWGTVQGENRAPNFFELLKAAIAQGSLGRAYRPTYLYENESSGQPADTVYPPDGIPDDQIIRIGTNILDQHDADNFPTLITFNGESFWGIENLPYFSEFFIQMYREGGSDGQAKNSQHYLYFELWNPHQPDTVPNLPGPDTVRVAVNGGQNGAARYRMPYWYYGAEYPSTNPEYQPFPTYTLDCLPLSVEDFREPKVIVNPTGSGATTIGGFGKPVNAFVFPTAGTTTYPPATYNPPGPTHYYNDRFDISAAVFRLEYSANGIWWPYSTFGGYLQDGVRGDTGLQHDGEPVMAPSVFPSLYPTSSIPKPDPRTFRYGASMSYAIGNGYYGSSKKPDVFEVGMVATAAPGEVVGNNNGAGNGSDLSDYTGASHPGMLFMNSIGVGVYTQGSDEKTGKPRPGDGALGLSQGSTSDGYALTNPMHPNNLAARPVMLNRPFRSVGDLGYVFRDEPWKTLNLFSRDSDTATGSADAALLDVFCLDDTETVDGRVDLTVLNPAALRGMLCGALRQETDLTKTISGTDADTIAAALLAQAQTHPVTNKADLVSQLSTTDVNAAFPAIKTQREAVSRALGQNTSTRSWNLMIDLVAQAGHYPPSATRLDQFIVEGEKRGWLHVTLDRYTGAVTQQTMELVNE